MKKVLIALFAFLIIVSCQNKTAKEELAKIKAQVQLEEQNKSIVQKYWEGKWNERRPEILDELQTPNVVYHGTSMEMNGIEEYKQVYSSYLSAMHNSKVEVLKLIAEGDFVMSHTRFTCEHKGELDGLPPTGNEVSVSLFTIFRLVEGKIAEEWEILDELGMMTQLGFELQMKD